MIIKTLFQTTKNATEIQLDLINIHRTFKSKGKEVSNTPKDLEIKAYTFHQSTYGPS